MKPAMLRWLILACAFLAGGCLERYTVSGGTSPSPTVCPTAAPGTYDLTRGGRVQAAELCGVAVPQ